MTGCGCSRGYSLDHAVFGRQSSMVLGYEAAVPALEAWPARLDALLRLRRWMIWSR